MNSMTVPGLGDEWTRSSLLWGTRAGQGDFAEQKSPLDGSVIQRCALLSRTEMAAIFADGPVQTPVSGLECEAFALRLHGALGALRGPLLEAMQWETGFLQEDCEELVAGSLTYAEHFLCQRKETDGAEMPPIPYTLESQARQIRLTRTAWGTILVILPQNAFLIMAVTALLNALAAGNRVILRAPQQSARSAALLAMALEAAQPPQNAVSVVLTRAKELLECFYQSAAPGLVHYMGSSRHAPQILSDTFQHGKAVLIDGEGNGWVWVGADACPETAAKILTAGALRYNGQTCTSINGALIHPTLYSEVRDRLTALWGVRKAGNPLKESVHVGPLFDAAQAEWCARQIEESGGTILCGGIRHENLLAPTLVERPAPESLLVSEGLFGPALWIAPADEETFASRWQRNRYPLCAGILSPGANAASWCIRLTRLARLTLNGDPSVEYLFEPWGGYPASGLNPVGEWREKYQRVVQIDAMF